LPSGRLFTDTESNILEIPLHCLDQLELSDRIRVVSLQQTDEVFRLAQARSSGSPSVSSDSIHTIDEVMDRRLWVPVVEDYAGHRYCRTLPETDSLGFT